ncbi:YqhA family protein [Candidatus Desantisbacteria bacterium]|nr:YqhA family protein [Candidatus Desantisbacteria bacterium]
MKWIEKLFEATLWNSRFIVLLAVVASMVSAIILFLIAAWDVGIMTTHVWQYMTGQSAEPYNVFHDNLVGHIIGAVDDFLLGTVLLIFSLGLYELFISKIDAAENTKYGSNILLIRSLDDLKERLAKVILMILIVSFFKHVLHASFIEPLNILCLGGGILCIALALYFGHKAGGHS